MLRRASALAIAALLGIVGCTSDDSPDPEDRTPPTANTADDGSGNDTVPEEAAGSTVDDDSGSFRIVLEVSDQDTAGDAAAGLDQLLDDYDTQVSVQDDVFVEAIVNDVTEAEADAIDLLIPRSVGSLTVRPVLNPSDSVEGAELLTTNDGVALNVGPAQTTEPIFGQATVTNEFGFGLDFELPEAGAVAFNAIAEQCFEMTPTCPTGQLAIIFDGEILTAPEVRAANFADSVSVTGRFEEEEVVQLAQTINWSLLLSGITSVRTSYEAN